jgi:hypothetical protein
MRAKITTTFQLHPILHDKLKLMCLLTHVSMGEFIRLALKEKLDKMKGDINREQL